MRRSRLRAALAALAGFPGRCVIFPIKLYRRFISPLKGTPTCRFTPTCSEYAIEAIKEWGAVVGLALAAWRVLRCNPFGGCGHDPVPKRRRRVTKDTDGTSDDRSDM